MMNGTKMKEWSILVALISALISCGTEENDKPKPEVNLSGDAGDSGIGEDGEPSNDDDDNDDSAPCIVASPDCAPDPENRGPYPVGVMTVDFTYEVRKGTKSESRTIKTEIWYPTTDEAAQSIPEDEYNLMDEMTEEQIAALEGEPLAPLPHPAHRNAPLRTQDAPYPLLLFSHGNGGIRYQSAFFTNHISSHGYIVVAPDHTGDTASDLMSGDGPEIGSVATSATERPQDIDFLIKEFFKKTDDESDFFYGAIDIDRVGISGHSFGGHTAVVEGGLSRYISAAAPMAAPYVSFKLYDNYSDHYPVPVLIHGATKDDTVEYSQQVSSWEKVNADYKVFASLIDGGHFSYTDICRLDLERAAEALALDIGYILEDGCGEENIAMEEAHRLINISTVGFFNFFLRDSLESAIYFSPEYFSNIEGMEIQGSGEFQ
ncbi:MAG: hypothetical protein Kow0090_14670 [Myxococcota bacterium]